MVLANFFSLIIIVSSITVAENVHSCSCASRSSTIVEFVRDYNSYDLIFVGSAKKITNDENGAKKIIAFEIIKTLKTTKSLEKTVDIDTPLYGAGCGLHVIENDKWLVFATKRDYGFYTHLCTPSSKFVNDSLKKPGTEELNYIESLISKKDGYYSFRFKNGNVGAEGYYKDKLADGMWRYNRTDGSQFQVCYFNQGVLDSLHFYYSNADKNYLEIRKYQDGKIVERVKRVVP